MANTIARGQMIFHDKNIHVQLKESIADKKAKSTRAAAKKDGLGFGSRKALNDITSKACPHPNMSSRRKNIVKEEYNIVYFQDMTDAKTDAKSPCCCEEPDKITMLEFSDWLKPSNVWVPPPSSPMLWDSLASSVFSWNYDTVEFGLKEEDDD